MNPVLEIPDASIVTAGETTDDDTAVAMIQRPPQQSAACNTHDDDEDDDTLRYTQADELFDEQADDQDEAYVYKYLRSGVQETVKVVQQQAVSPRQETIAKKKVEMKVYKPRNSDAVLSCPCCFNIVCMDCQRHEKYADQYRAMFVMGITVQWDVRLVYSESAKALVPDEMKQGQVPPDDGHSNSSSPVYYYQVSCGNCETVVAALDMVEEVYHFYGCLASS